MEVYSNMSGKSRPTGHLQVRPDKRGGGRSYWAFWYDQDGERGGRRLGPAHVRDSGRRSSRGATIWRAGNGPRPTPEHLTPKDAEAQLDVIPRELEAAVELPGPDEQQATLADALYGSIAERERDKGLKRSTLAGYNAMTERMYRDPGADTPLRDFANFKSYKVRGEKAAKSAGSRSNAGRRSRPAVRPSRSPPRQRPCSSPTNYRAPGSTAAAAPTRVVPLNAQRPTCVTLARAKVLEAEGYVIARRKTKVWMLVQPAAPQTRNEYRDVLSAAFDYAVRKRWLDVNPLAEVKRASKREERERILRREDFYDTDEVARLLIHAADVLEEAFWLCGAHAGLRLPGEALGMKWGPLTSRPA
jgi:hypothetical protein